MRATAQIIEPDNIELSVTVTMTVGEWDNFRAALNAKGLTGWPYFRILNAIGDATLKAKIAYYATVEE